MLENQKDNICLDLGCGNNKKEGYIGIDIDKYEGVTHALDLRKDKLPYEDKSVSAVYASHFLEHLTFEENLRLFNEVYRVLKPEGIFEIIVPHGSSYAGMVDLSHKTFWTEDTFGYFTPDNKYYYAWFYEENGERVPIINKWNILKNDNTPPKNMEYTREGWLETTVKLREVHALLQKMI